MNLNGTGLTAIEIEDKYQLWNNNRLSLLIILTFSLWIPINRMFGKQ